MFRISIHAPSRERRYLSACCMHQGYFNPRSLTGATVDIHHRAMRAEFQSTLPHGSDYLTEAFNIKGILFQSTLPHGSDHNCCYYLRCNSNFNPRSLTGATNGSTASTTCTRISIHAPSRERPYASCSKVTSSQISIHAPSRERPIPIGLLYAPRIFQSTLPHGSDWHYVMRLCAFMQISIHAPSRERLVVAVVVMEMLLQFQSTLPHGSDHYQRLLPGHTGISIHAPSRERRAWSYGSFLREVFQSTLPHGSD